MHIFLALIVFTTFALMNVVLEQEVLLSGNVHFPVLAEEKCFLNPIRFRIGR